MLMNMRSRKMKGDYESVTVLVGMVAFAGTLVALIFFVQANLLKFGVDLQMSERDLLAVDAAHLVKDCFSSPGTGALSLEMLKAKNNSNLCDAWPRISCNAYDVSAKVELLEGKQNGGFIFQKYNDLGSRHSIFVTVTDGTNNYVARLYASVSNKGGPDTSTGTIGW